MKKRVNPINVIIVLFLIGYSTFTLVKQEIAIRKYDKEKQSYIEQIALAKEKNAEYKRYSEYVNSDEYIEKMRHVFGVFRQYSDKVALLWRPHPLIKATISSMRPQLWIEYDELVNEYLNEQWGMYDDSADLDRAIAISDAYYGDGSSLVQLCQSVGMPVMIQNVDCR